MTRPDDRLLVPVSVLPFVPEGVQVWHPSPRSLTTPRVATRDRHGFVWMIDAASESATSPGFGGLRRVDAGEYLLDLSAPALRDGVPERLDALPWALGVLGWRCLPIRTEAGWFASRYFGIFNMPVLAVTDTSGLSPDEASRAVVAAALRARVKA